MNTLLFLPVPKRRLEALVDSPAQAQDLNEAVAALAAYKIVIGLESGKSPGTVLAHVEQSLIVPLYQSASAGPESEEKTREAAQASIEHKLRQRMPGQNAQQRLKWLDRAGVRAMLERDIKRELFLTPLKRHWRTEYASRATEEELWPASVTAADGTARKVNNETGRASSRLVGDFCEGGTIQGVAGCGKTEMLTDAVSNTPRDIDSQILILTLTADQSRGAYQRLHDYGVAGLEETIWVVSFRDLLLNLVMAQTAIGVNRKRASTSYQVSEARIAEALNIHAAGALSAKDVVRAATTQVNRFCHAVDSEIMPEHCPTWATRQPYEVSVITECARRYWSWLTQPSHTQDPRLVLPLRLQHLCKIAQLYEVRLPNEITSVFVDEAHDVPPALLRWLNTHFDLGIWLLGDEFQHYGHHDRPFFQRAGGYGHYLSHSYRCAREVEDIINPILTSHPANKAVGIEFEGHPNTAFQVRWQSINTLAAEQTVLVCANELDCLEHFLRLNHAGIGVALMGRTKMDVPAYLRSLVGLYHDGQRPRVANLWRFTQWEQLERQRRDNPNFQRIQDMLARGFDYNDCDQVCQSMGQAPRRDDVRLALPTTIKNHQYPRVELSRSLLAMAARSHNGTHGLSEALSQLYTAGTRATHELVLPGEYRDWLMQ